MVASALPLRGPGRGRRTGMHRLQPRPAETRRGEKHEQREQAGAAELPDHAAEANARARRRASHGPTRSARSTASAAPYQSGTVTSFFTSQR